MSRSLWIKLIIDGTVPSLIYYIFYIHHHPLIGAVLGISWSVGTTTLDLIRFRTLNVISIIGAVAVVINGLTLLLTHNPSLYLASYAINSALIGLVLLISCLFPRSLFQVLLEQMPSFKERIPETVRLSRRYRNGMKRSTAIVGGLFLVNAVLLIYFQLNLSVGAFLITRKLLSGPLVLIIMFASFAWNRRQKQHKHY